LFTTIELPIGFEEPKVEAARVAISVSLQEMHLQFDKLTKALHGKVEIARDKQLGRKNRVR